MLLRLEGYTRAPCSSAPTERLLSPTDNNCPGASETGPDGATPAGLATALVALKRGELLSQESTDTFLSTMAEARTGPRRLKGGLPSGWSIAHKTGTDQD